VEGVHRWWTGNFLKGDRVRGSGGQESPSAVQGQSPSKGSVGLRPPEAEAKCEISEQILAFKISDLMSIGQS